MIVKKGRFGVEAAKRLDTSTYLTVLSIFDQMLEIYIEFR